MEEARSGLNQLSLEISKGRDPALMEKSKSLKAEVASLQAEVDALGEKVSKIEIMLPNWISGDVPRAVGDENEKPIAYAGRPIVWSGHAERFSVEHPGVEFTVRESEPFHHHGLVGKLVDQEKAGEVAQARFYYELNELAVLDLALGMYAIEFFRGKGYGDTIMIPPYMIRRELEEHITYFEAFQDTIFEIEKEGLLLAPSSEHTIVAYYRDRIFESDGLPHRIIAWSPSFRREAGAHGRDTKGIFRVKQFHKVEMHSLVREGEDMDEIENMAKDIQDFLSTLGLPSRSVIVPSGEMDKRALKQIDVQTWMPGQGAYRETHSVATLGTWVSEKLMQRYRVEKGGKEMVRNVYATGVAVQRQICAIAENHYDHSSGEITVPKPLLKYMMGIERIRA